MNNKLTGQYRYRTNWHQQLILQVEEEYDDFTYAGGTVDCDTFKRWRDARVEDLSTDLQTIKER